MIALRVAKRRTVWQTSPIDELIKTEFSRGGEVDLNLSVYEVDDVDIVRAVAEHCASFSDPKAYPNLDMSGRPTIATPGATHFKFTIDAHRELRFQDVDELRSYIQETILPQFTQRCHVVERAQVKAYAHGRRDAGDPEWVRFFSTRPKWP
jgi:hypothetical protein